MYNEKCNDYYTKIGAKLHYKIIHDTVDTPLVLIHGQGMCGEDYQSVYEQLSKKYTLYLVDCFGHGESEKKEELYRCNIIGDAIVELIQNEIGNPCVKMVVEKQ